MAFVNWLPSKIFGSMTLWQDCVGEGVLPTHRIHYSNDRCECSRGMHIANQIAYIALALMYGSQQYNA
jgi:hypothetical protein